MKFDLVSNSEEETKKLGADLAGILGGGDVVALDGDLGAGKTVFTKGFCEAMEVKCRVVSPTFNIVNEYNDGRLPVYHFDTYRLEGPDDFEAAGLDEYFDYGGICIIEWSSVIEELLPKNTVHLKITGSGDKRSVEVTFDEGAFDADKSDRLIRCLSER